jgi:hypothetical protein
MKAVAFLARFIFLDRLINRRKNRQQDQQPYQRPGQTKGYQRPKNPIAMPRATAVNVHRQHEWRENYERGNAYSRDN